MKLTALIAFLVLATLAGLLEPLLAALTGVMAPVAAVVATAALGAVLKTAAKYSTTRRRARAVAAYEMSL